MPYGLAPTAILKKRFSSWFLIRADTNERLRLSDGAKHVVLEAVNGNPTDKIDVPGATAEQAEGLLAELKTMGHLVETSQISGGNTRCYDAEFPLDSLNLLITNRCNLSCRHCYVNSGAHGKCLVSGNEWINVIEQAEQLGAFGINVSGGEPLLHPEFSLIAAALTTRSWLNANLNTNGTLIDERFADIICRAFRSVQVSLDGPTATHDRLRGIPGCHERSIAGIRLLIAAGVQTNVGFTVTTDNISKVLETTEFCERLGIDTMNIGVVAPVGRAAKGIIDPSRLVRAGAQDSFYRKLTEILTTLKRREGNMKILTPFRDGEANCQRSKHGRRVCGGDDNMTAYVLHDGTVTPCDKLPESMFGVGNIKTTPFNALWNSDAMKRFKNMTDANQPSCSTCSDLEACGGACPARAFMSNGDTNGPDPLACAMSRQPRQ
jgi:radical SAM protein with 4Fe4S-binding SPASM domain